MELLQQSVEREKVRRGQKGTTGTAGGGREKRRRQKKRVVNVKPPEVNREPPVMHVDTTRVRCLLYLFIVAVCWTRVAVFKCFQLSGKFYSINAHFF